ncbi:MAG: PAS domain-containing sensor histidine kinase [Candidatus Omnitrophota bacterium]
MILVVFIYGLAFFVLGFAIFIFPKKDSVFKLAKNLWLIASFGIIHGVNEWIDMFILIKKPIEITFLKVIGLPILAISFLFLIQFGVKVIAEAKKKYSALKILPVSLFIIWVIATILSDQRLLLGGIWARYILGVPGIFLTAYALFLQIPEFKEKRLSIVARNLKLAISACLFYGILSGLIVPKAGFLPASIINYTTFLNIVGVPVQVFRSICAVVMAYGMVRVLSIFDWETKTRIKNAKEFTDNILKTMQDGLFIVSPDCTIQYMNKIFMDTFGENAIGKKCYEVVKMDKEQCDLCPVKGQIDIGKTETIEVPGIIGEKTFLVSHTGMKNPDGSPALLEIFRDITKLKQLEKAKDSLTHMIVHDLNNPLMVVSGRLQLLKMDEESFNQKQKENLNSALLSSEGLKGMISNLLDISKMEEGKLTLRPERFRIGDLAKEVLEQMSVIAQSGDKSVSLDVTEAMPDISADKELIRRVISNLINNAIKHSPSKGTILVKAFFNQDDGNVHIQVKDSGEGIPKEYLDKIFDKFVQVEDKKAKMGRGLGLAFCKMAVEAHDGKIWVESELGKGSTFNFTIPEKK